MTGLRARILHRLARPASDRHRALLEALAKRFDYRHPFRDAPPYANPHDREAPPGVITRSGMLALAFRFAASNRIEGDYFEFGTYRGGTFLLAHLHAHAILERPIRFRLFDSFEGLPEPAALDAGHWKAGDYAEPLEALTATARSAGIRDDEWTAVKGFYDETLTTELAATLRSERVLAAVVWIDCDLYASTVSVLKFVRPLLQQGTVLCFDDFFAFRGRPDRGEQLALTEWLGSHPELEVLPYATFGWHGKAFLVHLRDEAADGGATSAAS